MILLLAGIASAVPLQLNHQGRLLDPGTGVPITGSANLEFGLFAASTGGASLWSESLLASLDEGYFAVTLGQNVTNTLDSDLFADNPELWLEVTVDGSALPRTLVVSVPYAIVAHGVSGGVVDASEIRIDGTTVIDGSGSVVAGTTLDGLGCSTDQVALYDGTVWGCATFDEATVDAFVANDGYALASDLSAVATSGDYADLSNTPSLAAVATSGDYADLGNTPVLAAVATSGDYADLANAPILASVATSGDYGDLANTPTLADIATSGLWSDLSGVPGDLADGVIDWAEVANRPAGLDDGDDDTLAGLGCTTDQVAMHDGSAWTCANYDAATIGALADTGGTVTGDLGATGTVTVGTTAAVTCSPGELRFETDHLEVCVAADTWRSLETSGLGDGSSQNNAAQSCLAILGIVPGALDGTYWIDPDNDGDTVNAVQVDCDMANGGWTAVWGRSGSALLLQGSDVGGYTAWQLDETTMRLPNNISCASGPEGMEMTLIADLQPSELRHDLDWTGQGGGDVCVEPGAVDGDGIYITGVNLDARGSSETVPFTDADSLFATCSCGAPNFQRGFVNSGTVWVR